MQALSLGSTITVATTITPTHDVHHLTGNGTISTINPPSPSFVGVVTFILDNGSISFDNNGNIAYPAFGPPGNVAVEFYYDPNTSKWYPNYN